MKAKVYKICVYVPESHLDAVKEAMFAAGAGKFRGYKNCAWQVKGRGQFVPEENSQPAIGNKHQLEYVEEYKVELICLEANLRETIKALKNAHPYEEPAFQVIAIESISFDEEIA